jgi:glycosyltransferase involved in cell wall biosynthesis
MRILLTVHQFFPDHANGTEVLAYQVAKELLRRGHEIRIVTGYPMKRAPPDNRFDQYEYQGLRIDRYYHQESAPVGAQANIAELEYDNNFFADWFHRFLNQWRPDIVHFFHLKNLSASAIDICHINDLSMVFTPTDFWLFCPTTQLLLPDGSLCAGPDRHGVNCLRHAIINTRSASTGKVFAVLPDAWLAGMLRMVNCAPFSTRPPFSFACALAARSTFLKQRVRLLDYVLAPTRLMERLLASNGMQPKKISLCRFGIDLSGFQPAVATRGTGKTLRIGFIGSLAYHKGAHILVEALRLTAAMLPVELQIYGSPAVYPEYVAELKRLSSADPRIRFCGTFPNKDIGKIFAALDVFVVPSLWYENTPLVIYSAQAAGCPILASNLEGMAEVIRNGVDGMLFPPGDSAALAVLIETLCNNREMVRKFAQNALQPKSIAEYTDDILGVYQEVVATKETAP